MASKAKKKKDENTELIRVRKDTLSLVKEHIKKSRQTIGGFYDVAAQKELQTINNP